MRQDLRFALRLLVKDRWFTTVAVLALGLGIGLNATVFTFVNAVLIRGLPFPDADRILHISGRNTATRDSHPVSFPDYEDIRQATRSFSGLAGYRPFSFIVTEAGRPPERLVGSLVSANTFGLLGQAPLLGRDFAPGEDTPGAAPVMILGHSAWMSRYAGDPNVVGRVVHVNGTAVTIVGVMPQGMKFPTNAEMWRPLVSEGPDAARRDSRTIQMFGRLAPGASRRQAETELGAIAQRLERQHPATNRNVGVHVQTFNERFNGGPIRVVFLALLGAVGFVLLIACANVANLLLARSAHRTREVAIRFAMGASRARIVRQLLVESVLLACLGGLFGLALALVGVRLFDAAVADVGKPYWIVFSFDGTVFGYFAAVCLATGIVFGVMPALQVSRTSVNETLKEGGRGTSGAVRARRLSSALVVAELTLTLVLLVGAGLMIRSFFKLYSFDPGVETTRLLTMRLQLPAEKYPGAEERRIFYETLQSRLGAIPGMQAAAIASAVPFGGAESRTVEVEGRPVEDERAPRALTVTVSASYFDVMGVTMRQGRVLRESDGMAGSEAVVVSERFAARFFPGEEPIGRRIRLGIGERQPDAGPWLTVVGVSPTIRQGDSQSVDTEPVVYRPYRLDAPAGMSIIARSQVPPASLTPLVRDAVQSADPDQPVFQVQTMDEFLARARWPYRVFGTMFSIFALIALALSAVGLYAVTSYSVSQRTREIGVRMALGAQAREVTWLVLRRGMAQLGLGLGLGLALAWPLSGILQSLVVQIPTKDPVTFGSILAVLVLVMLAACVVPARRATRVDPLTALRAD